MKNNKWSQKGLKIDDVALNGAFWTHKKSRFQVSSKNWNQFVTDEFPYQTLILRKRLSVLYTKCIQFLPKHSQRFSTFYVGEMMIPWQHSTFSEFICSAFHFQGHIAQKISKCMKSNKCAQKGFKIDDVALNGAFWIHKKSGVQISSKNWNPDVTDEFSYKTLILRKRLSILYTKCIQFFP